MNVLHSTTKKYIYTTGVLTTLICVLAISSFQIAGAETTAGVSAEGTVRVAPKVTPRKDAREAIKDIRQTANGVRKDIMQNRASTTKALRDNRASTTEALKANREAMIKEVKDRRETLKKQLEGRKNEKKQKLDDKKRTVVNTALQNIFKKLTEKIARLTNIDSRLNAKVVELRAKGTDVSTAVNLLATAKLTLEKAQVDVEATRAIATEQVGTSTSKEILKGLVGTAETSIKSSVEAYKKAAENLRPHLEGSENASANASASTSASN